MSMTPHIPSPAHGGQLRQIAARMEFRLSNSSISVPISIQPGLHRRY